MKNTLKQIFVFCILGVHFSTSASNKDNSFKMTIDAISLNNQTTKDYYISDYMHYHKDHPVFIDQKNEKYSELMYYQEVALLLEQELNKQQYRKIPDITAPIIYTYITLQYSIFFSPRDYYSLQNKEYPYNTIIINTPFHKSINIEAKNNDTTAPFWSVSAEVRDDNINLRIYIPSMIKCAAPYFNKNFKGTVLCKR